MLVSVCICTWNRADLLDQTLQAMHSLQIPEGVEWELLVVNNNCTDHTESVIAQHTGSLPIRRLLETKQGLSHSRNCALDTAAGELILWTDDDVVVDSEWLIEYVEAARQWPEAMFFGGTIDPWFAVEPPMWIRRNLDLLIGPLAINQHGDTIRPLGPRELAVGANMAYRREVIQNARYTTNLGRIGHSLISGDEYEFISRLRARGDLGIWVGTARVRHYIPADRLTTNYMKRWFRGFGTTVARLEESPASARILGMPRWAIRVYGDSLLKSWLFAGFRNRRWLDSFKTARVMEGLLAESRRNSKTAVV
jgi:glycosyltransferase involved in cell wall biosynthesis